MKTTFLCQAIKNSSLRFSFCLKPPATKFNFLTQYIDYIPFCHEVFYWSSYIFPIWLSWERPSQLGTETFIYKSWSEEHDSFPVLNSVGKVVIFSLMIAFSNKFSLGLNA